MPKLRLISLRCDQTEDAFGGDEPYFTKNHHVVIWGPGSINNGQQLDLQQIPKLDFSANLSVQLWDQDTGFLDPDDLLGSLTVSSADAGQGFKQYRFNGDG